MARKIPVASYLELEVYDKLEAYRIKNNYTRSKIIEVAISKYMDSKAETV